MSAPVSAPRSIVIAGASLAGASAADALRRQGYDGELILIGAEREPPYERPPLSKAVLAGKEDEDRVFLRPADWYEEQQIDLRLGVRAVGLDATGHALLLDDNTRLPYDRLLIATGAIPRTLDIPGADLSGVHTLRSLDDARAISADLTAGWPVVVVGAGFIGAEVASVCRARGLDVTVIEPLAVPMARALGEEVGGIFADLHRAHGVDLRLGEGMTAIRGVDRVEEVVTSSGARIPAATVVIGVGVRPADGWLAGSGLTLADGVVVDEYCATNLPSVYAAGDVARWPYRPTGANEVLVRLEHYDNAIRQAENAARNMLATTSGERVPYAPVPYFWTEQFDWMAQYIGYAERWDQLVYRGEPVSGAGAIFYLDGGQLRAVLSINRIRDLGALRKLVGAGTQLDSALLADESLDLRELVKRL
ncbi:MAG TPA: FAD-dependent oxidoreductase [Ktedonobacterales bacterium]|jgi:3-phenylpropionate/trans-cinnamate dioxygenase ferredoxin reductase subunit